MIGILDYGLGNLHSVQNALRFLGTASQIISESSQINNFKSLIIPGVGSFQKAMGMIDDKKMTKPINEFAKSEKPILGICLGMHLLATIGYEPNKTKGLDLIPGEVKLMETRFRLPHVGWNGIDIKKEDKLFSGIKKRSDFYFVHSYQYLPYESNSILSTTDYEFDFVSSIKIKNIYGVQFHPEKSQKQGLKILKNFVDLINA